MKYRDSSASMHLLNGLVVGGDDKWAVGVELFPATTGSPGAIKAVADSTVAHLTIESKGTGGVVRIGSTGGGSTGGVFLGSTTVTNSSAASAYAVKGVFSATLAWASTAITSGAIVELTVASTTADVMPGDLVVVDCAEFIAPIICGGHRLSTAAASRLTVLVAVPGSTASSTLSGTLRINWVDLT